MGIYAISQHLLQIGVVGVSEDGTVMRKEKVVEFGFGAHHSFERAESLQVCFAYVGDQSVVRFGYLHQFLDIPRM